MSTFLWLGIQSLVQTFEEDEDSKLEQEISEIIELMNVETPQGKEQC